MQLLFTNYIILGSLLNFYKPHLYNGGIWFINFLVIEVFFAKITSYNEYASDSRMEPLLLFYDGFRAHRRLKSIWF